MNNITGITKISLKRDIEQIAAERGESVINTISMIQAACVLTKNEALLEMLVELKHDYIPGWEA